MDEKMGTSVYSAMIDDHHRLLEKIIMIIRLRFREYFGIAFSNKWGYFLDRVMSRQIYDYADWIKYKRGDFVLKGHLDYVYDVVVSDDGSTLYSASKDRSIISWDITKPKETDRWHFLKPEIAFCLAYRSGLLVAGMNDGCIHIWTADTHRLLNTLKGHSNSVRSVSFTHNGDEIISASSDTSIRVWSVKKGVCTKVLMGHTSPVRCAKSKYGFVISGSADESIKVWNPTDGDNIRTMTSDISGCIYDICFNCKSSLLACLYRDGFTIFEWPRMKVVKRSRITGYSGCFHPSKPNILAIGDYQKCSLRVYDVRSATCIFSIKEHHQMIDVVEFSPDGSRIFSADRKGKIRMWDVKRDLEE